MTRFAACFALILSVPAFAQDDSPMSGKISDNQFIAITAIAAGAAAWLAYEAGDDAAESQRNLRTIGVAYAALGAVIWYKTSRSTALSLQPVERGALLRTEVRFGD